MTTIRKIVTSKIDGNGSNSTDANEIRPYGEISLYVGDNNKLELLIFDGLRTHVKSKVLNKGTFYGGDADSSDGLNYDTIKLVPDEVLRREGSDQYLVIDPTIGEPGHIHIRAGGTIDSSSADLFLGGEKNHVRVSDVADRVIISTDKGDGSTSTWTFNDEGKFVLPGGGCVIGNTYDVNILSGNDGSSAYGDVNITTNNPFSTSTWSFGTMGELTLPGGGEITSNQITNEVFGTTTTSLTLVPGGATEAGQRLEIYATVGGEGNHLHLTAGESPTALYLGNDSQYVRLGSTGEIEVSAQNGLTLWGEGVMSNAYVILPNNTDSSSTSVTIGNVNGDVLIQASQPGNPVPNNWFFGRDGVLTLPSGGNITFDSSATSNIYGVTGIEFADGTTQTTAFSIGTAPLSSTSTGTAGTIAYDASYFYVCTATNAWQRISWDNTPW